MGVWWAALVAALVGGISKRPLQWADSVAALVGRFGGPLWWISKQPLW